jgi:hypothetical protein
VNIYRRFRNVAVGGLYANYVCGENGDISEFYNPADALKTLQIFPDAD